MCSFSFTQYEQSGAGADFRSVYAKIGATKILMN